MKLSFVLCLCALAALSSCSAFVVAPAAAGRLAVHTRRNVSPVASLAQGRAMGVMGESSFVARVQAVAPELPVAQRAHDLQMGKMAKFGIFSPAVIAAKVALGETRLNKIRGKAIALHSQVITEYCRWVGASSKLRGLLIRKAKTNGDTLGFLW